MARSPRTRSPHVLVVGPSPRSIGGMATVMGQMRALRAAGRHRLRFLPVTARRSATEGLVQRTSRHLRQLARLWRALRRHPIGVVHVHTCSGFSFWRSLLDLLAARLCGVRIVLHVHGAAFDVFYDQSGVFGRWGIRWALARADRVVALSRQWANKLSASAPRARVVVIENAVALPPNRREERHSEPLRLLMLAKMDAWKGVADLLEGVAILRSLGTDVALTLAGPAGTAGDAQGLADAIRQRGLHPCAEYVGAVSGEVKAKWFRWADVYVQPSHHEGMPIALLEALAYGLPIVATAVGAVPEVVTTGQEGLLVPPRQPRELARAIGALVGDRSLRFCMGKAGRKLAEARFSMVRLADDLAELYDTLAEKQDLRMSGTTGQPVLISTR